MMPEAPAPPRRETVFQWDEATGVTFRIPALLYLPHSATFLAFAEKRAGARDEDAQHLVLRRGRRRGRTVEWGPLEELPQLRLPGHRTMNPCPVLDAAGGAVLLLCICVRGRISECRQLCCGRNAARLCCTASADGGRDWAPLRDITAEAAGRDLPRWATCAVGPGHGVQLASGRLAVPAYAYRVGRRLCGLPCGTRPRALLLYSDDRGRSWSAGAAVEGEGTGECQVAEVHDGAGGSALYLSARPWRRQCRMEALSTDQGLQFGRAVPCKELCEPPHGCQGSVVSFIPGRGDEGGDGDHGSEARGSNTKASNALAGGALNNEVVGDDAVTNSVISSKAKANDAIANDAIANNVLANNAKVNHDKVNNVKTNDAVASDAVTNIKANDVKANAANATIAKSANINDTKANDAKVNDANPKDAKLNDAKANDAKAKAASWLLFSHPTDPHHRRDLGIYVNPSPLSRDSWWPPWLLYQGPCGYSDLAVCPDGLFGCLFECGEQRGYEEIAFCLFSQSQLLSACSPRGAR